MGDRARPGVLEPSNSLFLAPNIGFRASKIKRIAF